MPKQNARENTRNRTQAKKRARNRLLRATLSAPKAGTGSPARTATKARNDPSAAAKK
jgi:hypothetical protein